MHLSTVAILNEYDYIKSSLKNRRINSERLVAILNEYDYIKSWLRPGDRVEIFSNVAILNEYDYIKRKKQADKFRALTKSQYSTSTIISKALKIIEANLSIGQCRNTQRVRLYQKRQPTGNMKIVLGGQSQYSTSTIISKAFGSHSLFSRYI